MVVIGVLLNIASPTSAVEPAVARYSTIHAVLTVAQRDPLTDLVTTIFPVSVTRVGTGISAHIHCFIICKRLCGR